jgi:hypothetical protein
MSSPKYNDIYNERYDFIKNSSVPFLADEVLRANPLEYKHLRPVVKIPY